MRWIEALKTYNKHCVGKEEWGIPRKGTPEYREVYEIMEKGMSRCGKDRKEYKPVKHHRKKPVEEKPKHHKKKKPCEGVKELKEEIVELKHELKAITIKH